MASGTIRIRLRPIKLAFLVDPTDSNALLEAIEINTFLWGGMFNPIVPTYKGTPRKWQEKPFKNPNPQSIVSGYLDNFDPDYVVPLGKCSDYSLDVGSREMITAKEILDDVLEDGTPKYGIGLLELLQHFIDKELKFQRRYPLDICVPSLENRYVPFLASVFGILPENLDQILWENFADVLEAKKVAVTLSNYTECLAPNKLFLSRLSTLYIDPLPRSFWGEGPYIFFLDATKSLDIIDYWNLRAIGWDVIPVPKRSTKSDTVKQFVSKIINENYVPRRSNPEIYHYTTLLKSRSISEDEHREFMDSLEVSPPDDYRKPKMTFQTWYPRIWDEGTRDKGYVQCCGLEAATTDLNVTSDHGRISFKTLDPEFIGHFGGHGKPRFANEIELRLYDDEELFAEVIPEGDRTLIRAIGNFGFGEWRFSRTGMVYLSRHPNWSVHLTLPKAKAVFSQWLESKQWKVELSSPGRIANQMIKQLGGPWAVSTLANEGIIKLLEKMSEGKPMKYEAVVGEIKKIANQIPSTRIDPNGFLQRLTTAQILRLGAQIKCTICDQHSWYAVSEFDYELQCPKCLERFSFPSHSPKEIKWSYWAFGPFSLPNQADGAYTVLLTLRFFSQALLLDGATTPIMSFTAQKDDLEIEADLGLFFQGSKGFRSSKTELIFVECKTNNHFKRKDVDKMKRLGDQFPGAILVFATLRESLTEKEKRMLRPVVNRGRRNWKAGRPYNPVLILTGTELFSMSWLSESWKNRGGIHALFAQRDIDTRDLSELYEMTQQLYLGVKSRYQWLDELRKEPRRPRPHRAQWTG
ncbi:hypothetical protein HYR99_06530 [Candidatus Poribacteria bacterium]|nr:hypothetical protein [Candidatus Poribacteria bacterium]